ncbi:imidazolonepropionase [candidate division KSB1 bacterium]|nr:imidazolonepropionase [candidate division KSB1 bacterium]
MKKNKHLFGPFTQIVTMKGLPPTGAIDDDRMDVIPGGGLVIENGIIIKSGFFETLEKEVDSQNTEIHNIKENLVLLPGLIDAHTHICYAGSRSSEYAERLAGKTYQEIAKQGGGIMSTVRQVRQASLPDLVENLKTRCSELLADGITTCEVKSGYGLTVKDELKMLQAIHIVNDQQSIDLIPTALPAHVCPPEFEDPMAYIQKITRELLPEIVRQKLAERADIYIDEGAFNLEQARVYLEAARKNGFSITLHADQFRVAGSRLAIEYNATSADHLETSGQQEIDLLAKFHVTGVVLPGASLGLGLPFAPARRMLDSGMTVAIASNWNPGSAPMGDLLVQACLIGVYEKLSLAETLAGITTRAAMALECQDRGTLEAGKTADMIAFPCSNYQEVVYRQGKIKPVFVWKNGIKVK